MHARTTSTGFRSAVAIAALLLAQAAAADLVGIVNDIRSAGCGRRAPAKEQVRADSALDTVARLVARGAEIGDALAQSNYSASKSTVINIGGAADDAAIREVLADGFCAAVNDRAYTAVGTYLSGNAFWLVLAAPGNRLGVSDAQTAAERVLELVNDARAKARRCGGRRLSAVPPLTLSATLSQAAAAHAADMAANGVMTHRGSDGSNAGERVTRTGYQWRAYGENVAAGQADADAVVESWLDSPGHCTNIMGEQFREMGVAFELAPQSPLRILWAQVFAAPR
jgi:uncharacterized protein YkwD